MSSRAFLLLVAALLCGPAAAAKECPPGFEFKANSGVGCVQMDCFTRGGHWSSTQQCICADGQRPCRCSVDYSGFDDGKCFPDCPFTRLVSCVDAASECPPCPGESDAPAAGPAAPLGPTSDTPSGSGGTATGVSVTQADGSTGSYQQGRNLQSGNRVQVAAGGRARFGIPGEDGGEGAGGEVSVSGPAEFVVPEAPRGPRPTFAPPPRKTLLQLIKGGFLLRLRRLFGEDGIWIEGRVSTTGVRGTEFGYDVDPERGTEHVMVHEGEVVVEGSLRGSALLHAGEQVWVRDGVVGEVQALTDPEWSTHAARFEPDARGDAAGGAGCQGILGLWRWFNGAMVECADDGTCTSNDGFSGPWRCLDPAGELEVQWARPGQQVPYVDTVTLSPDGRELAGSNQAGHRVGGRRPEFAGGEPQTGCKALIGRWRWFGGATVDCSADGVCSSSHGLNGPWTCTADSGQFEIRWGRDGRPDLFIDSVSISSFGGYLTGRNQHGVATGAVRE